MRWSEWWKAILAWAGVAVLLVVFAVGMVRQNDIDHQERDCILSGGVPLTDWPNPLSEPTVQCIQR